jgi:methionyl aminopeptidase
MTIPLFKGSEVERLRRASQAAAGTLAYVASRLAPGISTADIDAWVREDTARRGGKPSQLGFHGFPATVCTSRNQVVCHGIPRPDEHVAPGDIINVDVTTFLDGFHGDTSATFLIGEVSAEARHVVDVARRCRDAGIAVVRHGARLGDIGAAIEELAHKEGCSVVEEFGGHGVGHQMHAPPVVPHTGKRGTGIKLRSGMVLTVEPMVNLGRPGIRVMPDGWTVVTEDGSLSAQFEHTILVTRDGCEVLTQQEVDAGSGFGAHTQPPPAGRASVLPRGWDPSVTADGPLVDGRRAEVGRDQGDGSASHPPPHVL